MRGPVPPPSKTNLRQDAVRRNGVAGDAMVKRRSESWPTLPPRGGLPRLPDVQRETAGLRIAPGRIQSPVGEEGVASHPESSPISAGWQPVPPVANASQSEPSLPAPRRSADLEPRKDLEPSQYWAEQEPPHRAALYSFLLPLKYTRLQDTIKWSVHKSPYKNT